MDGNIIQQFLFYLSFPFVWFALIVVALISLCAALLGVTLVLKRYSFIGDGLSHVAFGALAVATALGVTQNTLVVLPVTVLVAMLLIGMGRNARIKGDAAIAMLSTGALAMGYLIMNVFSVSSNVSGDVCTTLFGSTSILTLKPADVFICLGFSVVVMLVFIFFYNRIFAVTFDENFSEATGMKTFFYRGLLAVLTAVVIVLGMKLVGSLLISALVVFPALSAMRLFKSFKSVVFFSSIMAVICAVSGIGISVVCSFPPGATIVMMDIILYIVCEIAGRVVKR